MGKDLERTQDQDSAKFVNPEFGRSLRQLRIAGLLALLIGGWLLLSIEVPRYEFVFGSPQPLVEWMRSFNQDTSLVFLWCLALPLFYLARRHLLDQNAPVLQKIERWLVSGRLGQSESATAEFGFGWVCLFLFVLGMGCSLGLQSRLSGLPPAFHDEYSYLFQAKTFLAGRISNPRFETAPELFDQMHVLNDQPGHFVSRYFPGAGFWLVPFVWLGNPYWGYAFAHGLISTLAGLSGRDAAGNGVGLLAGIVVATMPGLLVFSTLLLAHHPCLIGLALFLWAYQRFDRNRLLWEGLLAGTGLAFAMWCRPMTAFGIGLPYGIHFLVRTLRMEQSWSEKFRAMLKLGSPILVGLLLLLPYSAWTTGSMFVSPYQQYTQLHTPRHVYGFANRSRGEQWIAEQQQAGVTLPVVEAYDRWAEELTPALAWQNEKNRVISTGQWTLGIFLALITIILGFSLARRCDQNWWLLLLSLLSLHLVHIPYWYDGILHWHYVMEGALLIALLFARISGVLIYHWRIWQRHWLSVWWLGLWGIGLLTAFTTFEPFWRSPVTAALSEFSFSRERHAAVQNLLEQIPEQPAVVFFQPDPTDLHIDYVVNSPQLDAPVLRARWSESLQSRYNLQALFPGRSLWKYDVAAQKLERLPAAQGESLSGD